MKALVLYESFFGNTEKIAQAIGSGLMAGAEVETVRIDSVKPGQLPGVNLLVVGSATRGFMACPATRAWLKALPRNSLQGIRVAAFDTRVSMQEATPRVLRTMARMFGYAAEPIAAGLVKHGGTQVVPPAGFFVMDTEGPLREGELERAAAWGHELVTSV